MVILEPISGGGAFNIRSGLYWDEHLKNPVDREILLTDRTFVGVELIGITNPTMTVIIPKLWATMGTDDPASENSVSLIETDISGPVVKI